MLEYSHIHSVVGIAAFSPFLTFLGTAVTLVNLIGNKAVTHCNRNNAPVMTNDTICVHAFLSVGASIMCCTGCAMCLVEHSYFIFNHYIWALLTAAPGSISSVSQCFFSISRIQRCCLEIEMARLHSMWCDKGTTFSDGRCGQQIHALCIIPNGDVVSPFRYFHNTTSAEQQMASPNFSNFNGPSSNSNSGSVLQRINHPSVTSTATQRSRSFTMVWVLILVAMYALFFYPIIWKMSADYG
jgi:hypothetical protein